jgi:hypothetical protein
MDPSNQSANTENNADEVAVFTYDGNQYYGVSGWLLLLCVGLTIIGPLMRLGNIGNNFAELGKLGGRFPSLTTVVYIENAFGLILLALSIYAGISLWSVAYNAVYKAKIFFIVQVLLSIFDFFLVLMAGFPEPAFSIAMKAGLIGIVQSLIYAGIWTSYLNNSKRVHSTYNRFQ